jgi:hypothetical protein
MNFRSLIKFLFSLLFTIALSFFSGCKKENRCDCFKRTGDVIQETRALTGFTKIHVEDNINLFITQDSVFEVTVEAGKNIVPLITTEIKGNTLICENKNRCNFTRSYKKPLNVYVRMPLLNEIESNGTGNIKSLNTIQTPVCYIRTRNSGNVELTIDTPVLTTAVHGSCDLILHGKANNHECNIGGTGYLIADDLQTSYTFIHSHTLGLCYIYVRDLLICNIDQVGDVFCYGSPKSISTNFTSSGKLYLQ